MPYDVSCFHQLLSGAFPFGPVELSSWGYLRSRVGRHAAKNGHSSSAMAPSIAARGKIYKPLSRGENIPTDWTLDKERHMTDDPARALEGVILPMGGPKGSTISIIMDMSSGVLSGSSFAGHVTNSYNPTKLAEVGHFLIAIKPDLFMDLEEFKSRMDYLYQWVVGSEKMEGVDRIYSKSSKSLGIHD